MTKGQIGQKKREITVIPVYFEPGDTISRSVAKFTSNGSPVDISGWTFSDLEFKNGKVTVLQVSGALSPSGVDNNILQLTLSSSQTQDLTIGKDYRVLVEAETSQFGTYRPLAFDFIPQEYSNE